MTFSRKFSLYKLGMIAVEIQEKILRTFLDGSKTEVYNYDYLRSVLFAGNKECLSHLPLQTVSGRVNKEKQYLPRPLLCENCTAYNERKGRYIYRNYTIPIHKEVAPVSFFCLVRGEKIILDDLSYRVLATWACSFITSGIVEVLDTWRCSHVRHVVEEACLSYNEYYKKELEEQLPDLFTDLEELHFRCRKLTSNDFYIRPISFSYLDERGKHRHGNAKICLRVPIQSCIQLGPYTITSASGSHEKLYTIQDSYQPD